jgi:hypothetical protein
MSLLDVLIELEIKQLCTVTEYIGCTLSENGNKFILPQICVGHNCMFLEKWK